MLEPLREPALVIERREGLPFLVEHWYLGSRTRRYMMVRRFREVLEHARLEPGLDVLDMGCGWAYGTAWARAGRLFPFTRRPFAGFRRMISPSVVKDATPTCLQQSRKRKPTLPVFSSQPEKPAER
jgi:hypothetical protein